MHYLIRVLNLFLKGLIHVGIYMLIGGTFAPIFLLLPAFSGPLFGNEGWMRLGLFLCLLQWVLILTGMVLKSIWIHRFQSMHITIFLAKPQDKTVFIL